MNDPVPNADGQRADRALRDSEARLSALLAVVPMGVAIVGTDRRVQYGNPAGLRVFGEIGAMIAGGWSIRDEHGALLAEDERPTARALRSGEPVQGVELWLERGTERRVFEASAVPIRDEAGHVVAAASSFVDVTARVEAARALRERNAFLQSVLSSVTDGIFVIDRDLRVTYANDVGRRISETIQGGRVAELSPSREAVIRRVLAGEVVPASAITLPLPEGARSFVSNFSALRGGDGEIVGVLATTREVTKENAAHAAHELAAQVIENTHELVAVYDRELRVVLWNKAAEQLTGVAAAAALGRTLMEIAPKEAALATARIRRAFAGEASHFDSPQLHVSSDGKRRWATGSVVPLRDEHGTVTRVLLTRRDVTVQQELLERERQSETLSALGRLVGAVAHELRNPVFALSATLDACEAKVGDFGETRALVEAMRTELRAVHALIDELLDYGRPASASLERGALAAAIAEGVRVTAPLARERAVAVHISSAADVADCEVLLDRVRLARLFANVIDNAIRFAPRGTSVTVESSMLADASVRIVVEDRGPGFDPSELGRVFEPFFTKRRGGTGLGLAIAARVAAEHGGTIVADNHAAGGARVTVVLPRAPSATQTASASS